MPMLLQLAALRGVLQLVRSTDVQVGDLQPYVVEQIYTTTYVIKKNKRGGKT
jgi:hypothetical protein